MKSINCVYRFKQFMYLRVYVQRLLSYKMNSSSIELYKDYLQEYGLELKRSPISYSGSTAGDQLIQNKA